MAGSDAAMFLYINHPFGIAMRWLEITSGCFRSATFWIMFVFRFLEPTEFPTGKDTNLWDLLVDDRAANARAAEIPEKILAHLTK